MKLGDLLPVFAATDAASATAERNGRFSEFPDKEPTVKQMSDWLDVNLPVITKAHGELMRGALPRALIQLKAEADTGLTDYQTVAVDTTNAKTTMDCTPSWRPTALRTKMPRYLRVDRSEKERL